MARRFTTFLMLVVAAVSLFSIVPGGQREAVAQNRRILIEEYTGYWCGYCVRGALGIELLRARFPNDVWAVSLHGGGQGEPMENPQTDSLLNGTGLSFSTGFQGFPSMAASRVAIGGKWVNNDMAFVDTLPGISTCGVTAGLPPQAYTDTMVGKPAIAVAKVDNVALDLKTGIATCRVTATFKQAASGDLRFGLYLIEDSVSYPAGGAFDQHNYYSSTVSVGAALPNNPFYHDGSTIPGWQHMQVFRTAPGGVWGVKGVIPTSVSAGGVYSQTFSFPLPANIQNPNHLRLLGFVHQYSKTDMNSNMIMDVDNASFPPVNVYNPDVTVANGQNYLWAKANGSTTNTVTFTNNESTPVTLSLKINPAIALPQGWTANVAPTTITVPPTGTTDVTLTLTAPEQSAFMGVGLVANPVKDGFYSNPIGDTIYAESDNTEVGFYYQPSYGAENSIYTKLPSALKLHTSIIPNTMDVMNGLAIGTDTKYRLAILDNPDWIDEDGSLAAPGASLPGIKNMLAAGKGVFLTGPYIMVLQNDNRFGVYNNVMTSDMDAFCTTIGATYRSSEQVYNSSTGAFNQFYITATADPIGKGTPTTGMTASGTTFIAPFDVDASKATALFYFDKKTANNAGLRYTDPTTGGKLVFLGFSLSTLTTTKYADTIAQHSIDWLLGNAASVETPEVSAASLSASANPFHNSTEIMYTAEAGEHNISFSAYDVLGREVAKLTPRVVGENAYAVTFDASNLAEGAYTIIAHSSTGAKQVRVVSEH